MVRSVKPRAGTKKKAARRSGKCIPQSQVIFANGMRRLWMDHALWTRSAITSIVADLEDKDPVLVRLLDNQDDIGNYIKPYYGEAAGNQLAALLREHIMIAGQLVTAAKMGEQEEVDKYNKLWYENADMIAAFLSKANPEYSQDQLRGLLHRHLELVFDQASARIMGDWNTDIKAYDAGEDHIIRMADYLAAGIIKQFPQRFR